MLAPGKDFKRFDQDKAAKIQGAAIDVKPGGQETCNCGADVPDRTPESPGKELQLSRRQPRMLELRCYYV
jgi:hypothetical protein